MMRLPPAAYGNKSGNFDWAHKFEAWESGYEVKNIDRVPPPAARSFR